MPNEWCDSFTMACDWEWFLQEICCLIHSAVCRTVSFVSTTQPTDVHWMSIQEGAAKMMKESWLDANGKNKDEQQSGGAMGQKYTKVKARMSSDL